MLHAHGFKAVLATAALLSLLGAARTADAAATVNRFDIEFPATNCAGETLSCTGTLLTVDMSDLNPAGGSHELGIVEDAFRCVNPLSGVMYTGHAGVAFTSNETAGGASILTAVTLSVLPSHGPEQNSVVHVVFHTTVNPNGEETSFIDNVFIECIGRP